MAYTEKSFKQELPPVKVKLPDGQVLNGHTGGRLLPACVVWLWGYMNTHAKNFTFPQRLEYSWAAVVKSVNTGAPLIMHVETKREVPMRPAARGQKRAKKKAAKK